MIQLTWDRVRAWRTARHLLDRPSAFGAVDVTRRLAGVQAQVGSSAAQAVAIRRGGASGVPAALADRSLVRTWAQRGTLHLLPADEAPAYLSLLAAARIWEKPAWQREFASAATIAELADAAAAVLDGAVLTRDELADAILDRTGDAALRTQLGSGWGAVLKPLAWQGVLCNGPEREHRTTFTSPASWIPGWPGLPDLAAAAAVVVPAYLGVHGPATPAGFDQWLLRGRSSKAQLRGWFAELAAAGRITEVDVEGERRFARTADLDDLAVAVPTGQVRLLPAFDQFVLGPGTTDEQVLTPSRRRQVSRSAGWITPVVTRDGRVVGTWDVEQERVTVAAFAEDGPLTAAELDAEIALWGRVLDRPLTVTVSPG